MEEVFEIFALRYLVSNLGNVDSLIGKRIRLKPFTTKDGYKRVQLSINGKPIKFLVHRLVALCFLPNPHNYPQVNHIDGNKQNNHVSNLEWCTCKQNVRKAWELGLCQPNYGEKHGMAKITEAIVIEIFRLHNVKKWTQQRIGDYYGITKSQVSRILSRKLWQHVPIPEQYLKKETHEYASNNLIN